jgi:hypothetical protein
VQALKEWREKSIKILKRIFSAYNYLSIYLLVLIIFNIILLDLSLTNYLGYEFSIFNSAVIILLSGFFSIFYLKKIIIAEEKKTKIFKTLAWISFIFLLLPFSISFISLFQAIACPLKDGILFYAFLTVPAPVIGIALGVLSFSFSKRFSLIIFILSLFIIALIPVFEIYFNPQIYFYNPIVGYFPGTIYDEGIEVDFKLMIYRALNLLFFLSIIFLIIRALSLPSRYSLRIAWAYSIVVPLTFIILSSNFGYSTTPSRIKSELNKIILSEHYEIHYSSAIDDTLIKVIALHHEFYYTELEKYFNVRLTKRIISLIFNDREQKKKLFGTANADVAKPWIPEIYISIDNYDKTLKHEIAHCFAGEFGSHIFKVADNFNPSLIEGAAMASDPIYDEFDLDYMAALAFNNEFKIDVNQLFGFFNFFKQPSSLGYIAAGSFIKYLIDNYGIDHFKNLYTDLDFQKYYGKELPELVHEYETFLKNKFVIPEEAIDRAKYYYGRKSIFYKMCPRYVAKRINEAWKWYDEKRFEDAKKIFEELLSISDNYSPFIGLAYCYEELGEGQKAIDLLKVGSVKFRNTSYWYQMQFILADLLAKNFKISEADSIYKILLKLNPNRTLYSLSKLRTDLIGTDSVVVKYLVGENEEKYLILKLFNEPNYNYNTFPYLSFLATSAKINYSEFLAIFSKPLAVNDYEACFGLYKLSLFMCAKMDFERARKMAALSLRYNSDISFNSVLQSNFEKLDWLYKNKDKLSNFITLNN